MAEICPFRVIDNDPTFCHEGHPSYDDEYAGDHTCKAWGVVKERPTGKVTVDRKYGCKLIEMQS